MTLYYTRYFRLLVLTGVSIALGMTVGVVAMAQNQPDASFAIEPGKQEVIVEPGKNLQKTVTVTNTSNQTTRYSLSVEDMVGSNDPNKTIVLLGDDIGPYSLRNYVEFEETEFSLSAGERRVVPYTIQVDKMSEPGGYYGAIIVSNAPSRLDPNGADSQTGARVVSRLGSLLLLRYPGEVLESSQIIDFNTIDGTSVYISKNPDGFVMSTSNNGSVHLVPYGEIQIENIIGKVVSNIPVEPFFVLPDSTRKQTILFNDAGLMLGKYKANLVLNPGYGDQLQTAEYGFWVLPIVPLSITLVILIVLWLIIKFVFSKFRIARR